MAMRKPFLERVVIDGYKSIAHCDLSLEKLNILIGANGAGKSNFISAFTFLGALVKNKLQLKVAEMGGPQMILYRGNDSISRSLKMEFDFALNGYKFSLVPTQTNTFVFEKEAFGFHNASEKPQDSYFDDIKSEIGGYLETRLMQGTKKLTDKYVQPVLSSGKWKVFHFHDTSRTALMKGNSAVTDNVNLHSDAGNIASFLLRLKNQFAAQYHDIVVEIQNAFPPFDDFVLEPDQNGFVLLRWKQKDIETIFNPHQMSDGTIRFVCLATLLLQPDELAPTTVIIDEPELGLHPKAIAFLGEMLESRKDAFQIIVSTQSPELLTAVSPEEVIVTEQSDEGTVFKRLDPNSLKGWLDDYSLGDLWNMNIIGGRPQ